MDIPCVHDVPNKCVANCPPRHKQTMQRRRYTSTMRMDPLAECCSFTAHNPQQSQLKQQFSSYLIFLMRPVLGPRKTTTRSCAAVPCSHESPSAARARCTARHVFTDTARGPGSREVRRQWWRTCRALDTWWRWRWSHPSGVVVTVTGENLGIICLQDQDQVSSMWVWCSKALTF